MYLKSFGCSFVYGTDLPDFLHSKGSTLTWPALIADRFGLSYQCHAGGGQGNLAILDRLSQVIYQDPTAFFVIQWTYIDRFDYSDPRGYHFTKEIINDWHTARPGDNNPQSDFYFRSLHSEYRDKLTSLIYIKTAKDLLTQNGCRYIMTCMDPLLLSDLWHINLAMRSWQQDIAEDLRWFEGKDFLTWSRQQNFAMGATGHPLEQAHEAAADIMLPEIQALLNNKNSRS